MLQNLFFFHAEIYVQPFVFLQRGNDQATETPMIASYENVLSLLLEQHDLFLT
jgi:hypothetical protein